jgi:hypothetical protein
MNHRVGLTLSMIAESDEHSWIGPKLDTIRNYLTYRFPGYTVTDCAFPNHYYSFTVTNSELHRSYGLKVDWSRLSDPRNTPDRIWMLLTSGFVASAMVRAGEKVFTW